MTDAPASPAQDPHAGDRAAAWLRGWAQSFAALGAFADRRTLVMLALGFSAGLPNLLIFDTLSIWLRQAAVPLDVITLFSLATLAYSLKFLWAPLVDRLPVPVLGAVLGRRRSWMIVAQIGVGVALWLLAGAAPGVSAAVAGGVEGAVQPEPQVHALVMVAVFATIAAFWGATQDIVIDAWRIEAADAERQGVLAAAYQWGYRIAIIVAGAAPLFLASRIGWSSSYAAVAALMAVGIAASLLAPRERAAPTPTDADLPAQAPGPLGAEVLEWAGRLALFVIGAAIAGAGLSGRVEPIAAPLAGLDLTGPAAWLAEVWKAKPWGVVWHVGAVALGLGVIAAAAWPLPGKRTRPSAYFVSSLGAPLLDFLRRHAGSAALILGMICVYRVADFVLNLMGAFYTDVGFTLDEIAGARKVFGVVMSLLGVTLGGWAIARFGLLGPLVVGALAQPVSNIVFAGLAFTGPWLPGLYACIAVDNVSAGFAGTCLIAYMSSLTSAGFTATQYALFSSLYALPGKLLGAVSGRIVEGSALAAAPGGGLSWVAEAWPALPAAAFAKPAAKAGIPAEAYAAGYVTFFVYTAVIGVAAVVFALAIARRAATATPAPSPP